MPTKIFTILGGGCPFGRGCDIDSPSCRKCEHFYRTGTGTFFWCKHPDGQKRVKIAQKAPEIEQPKRKRGRPPGKTAKTGKKTTKKGRPAKKAILRPVKVIKQEIK